MVAVIYGIAVVLPDYYGLRLDQFSLWVPDLAWLAYGIIGSAVLLLVLRVAITTRAVWVQRVR